MIVRDNRRHTLVDEAKKRINRLSNWNLLKHWDYYKYIVDILENPQQTANGPKYSKRQILRLVEFLNGATSARSIPNSQVNAEFAKLNFGLPNRSCMGVKVTMRDDPGMEC